MMLGGIVLAVLATAAPLAVGERDGENRYALSETASAAEYLASARRMLPATLSAAGRITLRNRRGLTLKAFPYRLERQHGAVELTVAGERIEPGEGAILETDVAWSDLTLDYLGWEKVEFDPEADGETVHGQHCRVIALAKGDRSVRVWIDRRTGAMLQAEETLAKGGKRRLWGTRLKKFGDRWVPNVLEVETLGSGHRTRITVEEFQ